MKIHYINILLFALPLNILVIPSHYVHNQRNHKIPTNHTPKIPTARLLCECELYTPANYDNDPEMKSVMDNFNKQTQQRFEEYDERMKTTRQKCKVQCDKEVQKIILKDKLEKQMEQKLTTLETKINTDDIPTCVCEKSMAYKVEKTCLRCAQNLGGIVVPSSGVIGEIAAFAVKAWKTTEIAAATELAKQAGAAAGIKAGEVAGVEAVISGLKTYFSIETLGEKLLQSVFNAKNYADVPLINEVIGMEYRRLCSSSIADADNILCITGSNRQVIKYSTNKIAKDATKAAAKALENTTEEVTKAAIQTSTETIEATTTPYYTAIIASIVAIVIIVLVMMIIYLILRYRSKKKMKKKLQYIKLLEE
ncbi:rifin [Plasmodium reichenowi]|uniref:Rifin n=1 Tax=Plasmodium reichenowi TaxID=5854 RepID=A0A060RM60_PLARE|nr:rifin [Plasmodium reichenowi]